MTARRLLLVHAHPDDESIVTGATMAKYAAEGAEVVLVTCTRGEEGEIIPAGLAHLGPDRDDTLGEHRIGELDKACVALGVRDHRFLGGAGRYRDSGMMGAATNERPDCFWQADVEEAAHLLTEIVREVRPHVMITYDDNGGYGHPDHIQAHRVAVRAFEKAAERALPGSPWRTGKLYAVVQPQSALEESVERLRFGPGPFTAPRTTDDIAPATADHLATVRVDASAHWAAKALAMRAHATQISVEGELFALSNGVAQEIRGVEYFMQIGGSAARRGTGGVESDLFV
ncbi:N-acetyl-1-D-myo-inositol-2-amino-2-deoxy-alpha-D-glucopyranoside deacetylase [Streptomonospora litoralis]|uniref:1D-myo-inositol 2-acetamido-2-deoxy-alpha-D-glucopyranoside deacetylase n=1 Tax=Streptomonospora litoralis TaxID=2498135 RepID=A0A4P6PXZ8_9ACTN|nr:N-acetyl-1-D-myo-inositol-2-amino-2-deoxy-alpha-D-glucopyranoside deacetylase [Streptomonospora litoralis]QBI52570.1 1D-myo-inositol 2-acetamido-2-deoxy-alpha-D-glucopyranoside deacetylase [Streptomonospora litoralis]